MGVKRKIMILTAPFGHGHLSVAKGIMDEINKNENIEFVLYDLYSEEFPKLSRVLKRFHKSQYKRGLSQQTYKYVYYNSDKLLKTFIAKPYVAFGLKSLIKKIKEEQPDAIINTFPVYCSYVLKDYGIDIPIYTMITDYYANANWISSSIKRHFVSSENVVSQLITRGIDDQNFEVTGIPVRNEFYKEYTDEERLALKESYYLNPEHKVALLVAGANGVIPKFSKIVGNFVNKEKLSLLIVCGRNQRLFKRLNRKFGKYENVKIFEYVTNIHELMTVSDIMVTKPGGITITEASNMGLPMVLYKPIYGQELENAIYFSARGASTISRNNKELINQVLSIINRDDQLSEMKENTKKIAIKCSASHIVNSILNDLNELGERDEDQ